MDDTQILNWLQENRVSIWPSDKEGAGFTVFARQAGQYPIQPSAENLRAAVEKAVEIQRKRSDG